MAIVDAMSVVNADGSSATFAAGSTDVGAGGIAVQSLVWSPSVRTTEQSKGDQSGLFESFAYVKGMTIEAVGVINGISASDYWGRRAVLAAAIQPPAGALAGFNHGTVFATFSGTAYYAGVTLALWNAPLDLTGPTVTPYTINWLNRDGYWRLVSTNAQVRL